MLVWPKRWPIRPDLQAKGAVALIRHFGFYKKPAIADRERIKHGDVPLSWDLKIPRAE